MSQGGIIERQCSKKNAIRTSNSTITVTIKIVDDEPERAGVCGLYLASVVAVPHR